MLDYYVVTSLSAKSETESFRSFYCERVAMYKALDGQQDRRYWPAPALLDVLEGWLRLFPVRMITVAEAAPRGPRPSGLSHGAREWPRRRRPGRAGPAALRAAAPARTPNLNRERSVS